MSYKNQTNLPPISFTTPSVLKNGVILGLIFIVVTVLTSLIWGSDKALASNTLSSLLTLVIYFGWYYITSTNYRDQELGGYAPFERILGYIFRLSVISSILVSLYVYIQFKFIEPEAMSMLRDAQYAALEKQGMSEEEFESAKGIMELFSGPGIIAITMLFFSVIFSTIIGLIVAAIVKKWPRPDLNN